MSVNMLMGRTSLAMHGGKCVISPAQGLNEDEGVFVAESTRTCCGP